MCENGSTTASKPLRLPANPTLTDQNYRWIAVFVFFGSSLIVYFQLRMFTLYFIKPRAVFLVD